MSIKFRVTLWYTAFMALLVIFSMALLLGISNSSLLGSAKTRLAEAVIRSFAEVEWDDEKGRLDIDDDLEILKDGVWLALYDGKGYPLYGQAPGGFPPGIIFSDNQTRTIQSGRTKWYVYDRHRDIPGYGGIWIRGIGSQTDTEAAFSTIIRLSLVIFPIVILLAALGGYYITGRAFLPVGRMAKTAMEISRGNDLSRRIHLGDGRDELYQLAATFDNMLDRLQSLFEKEKQFTADASHELRTPISVIISQCEFALDAAGDEEQRESVKVILEQAGRMARLVSQLLILSRTDSGAQMLQTETVDVSELFEVTALEQEDAAAQRNISIETKIEPHVLMKADETMMMRFFINLISNAVTYGRDGGHVEAGLSSRSGTVTGYVKDDGIGIPADQLDKIWDRFYQVDESRTAAGGRGAGLGLSMVKWIAEAHKGKVSVESRLGEGSVFRFEFPSGTP